MFWFNRFWSGGSESFPLPWVVCVCVDWSWLTIAWFEWFRPLSNAIWEFMYLSCLAYSVVYSLLFLHSSHDRLMPQNNKYNYLRFLFSKKSWGSKMNPQRKMLILMMCPIHGNINKKLDFWILHFLLSMNYFFLCSSTKKNIWLLCCARPTPNSKRKKKISTDSITTSTPSPSPTTSTSWSSRKWHSRATTSKTLQMSSKWPFSLGRERNFSSPTP